VVPVLVVGDDTTDERDLAGAPDVEVWRAAGGAVVAYGAILDGQHCLEVPGIARFRFERSGARVIARLTPAVAPGLVEDAFRRTVLPLAMQVHGTEVLHASAVRSPRGVLAFCADSGTGKSTLAAALSRRGHRLWADDAVALDVSSPPVTSVQLPFRLRLRPPVVASLGEAAATRAAGLEGAEDDAVERLPVDALCILRRTDRVVGTVAIERLRPSAALPAVLSHAYCFSLRDPDRKREMLKRYVSLVARVSVFKVLVESGLPQLPAVVDRLDEWMRDRVSA